MIKLFFLIISLFLFQVVSLSSEEYAQLPSTQPPASSFSESGQTTMKSVVLTMEDRISLDLRKIEVVDALKFLSMKTGMNIITTKAVTGRVTLMVEDAPIRISLILCCAAIIWLMIKREKSTM